jgi:malate dehydrogenase (oxaloacetate-decarboxylating)
LPIVLDVGTNNQDFLKDDLYLGWRHERLSGLEYDDFVDRFIKAIHKRYPKVLLQWEDFGKNNARPLLDRYRDQILSFNDDIQGTAAVTLAALIAAVNITKQNLRDQRVVILGGGSAGLGISDMIVTAMVDEGLSIEEARRRIYIVEVDGLMDFNSRNVSEAQKPYIKSLAELKDWKVHSNRISFLDVVTNVQPSILIGVCAQGGAFTQEIIKEMSKHIDRPIIFPLSNPTSKAESTPKEVIEWTEGKAIIATGSPFDSVEYKGKKIQIGQCNNVYIFPGVGLGVLGAQATQVTDEMFLQAARTLAGFSPALKDPNASLFPPVEKVREVSRHIALAVAKRACEQKLANCLPEDLEMSIETHIWEPHYPKYI